MSAGPVVHEINTAAWLRELGATLDQVSDTEWDRITPAGVDTVWLMGVWERSPAGRAIALDSPSLVDELRRVLPDLTDDDVLGSAYCIRRYEVDARFGGRDGLAAARAALAARGVRLMVDFVPNHVAPDHPWLVEHPDRFVRGTPDDLVHHPAAFLAVGDAVIARGRDPYFPPWPDVAQLDAFSPSLRAAATDTLLDIASQADGVRCDMAMLMLTDVFARTWGGRVGAAPDTEYWADVIDAVRAVHPGFLFVAEAYWDLEHALQQLGFDHCYDKRLYDRLLHESPASVRGHLCADLAYQRGLVRFTENHDEPRVAAVTASHDAVRAAAVVVATLPGATLWHEGQMAGWRTRLPVFLGRRPHEPTDADLVAFHERLLAAAPSIRRGDWALCTTSGWPDDPSHDQLLTWCWRDGAQRHLVVVNDADRRAAGRVHVPWDDLAGSTWQLDDLLSGGRFDRDGGEIASDGLFVQLPAWGVHLLRWASPAAGDDQA
ncbi:MAG: alpha-amylase family glycosyl hydrolase [Ilumatobacteraceae bacterium]|nr:alpha-amylase family glycosyl hydrolase [Ilumatobacteraceae bacterium]